MEFSSSNIKKFLYFLKRELFLYFQKNPTLFSPSKKNKNKIHPDKLSYTSGNGNPEKTSYIFLKESFSHILENGNPKTFFIF